MQWQPGWGKTELTPHCLGLVGGLQITVDVGFCPVVSGDLFPPVVPLRSVDQGGGAARGSAPVLALAAGITHRGEVPSALHSASTYATTPPGSFSLYVYLQNSTAIAMRDYAVTFIRVRTALTCVET